MRQIARYALTALVAVVGVSAVLWPFLEAGGRTGLLVAVAVALPSQILVFAGLEVARGWPNGLFAAMAGGLVVRVGVLTATALAITRFADRSIHASAILGLAGFLFALALLEAGFVRDMKSPRPRST